VSREEARLLRALRKERARDRIRGRRYGQLTKEQAADLAAVMGPGLRELS
jgi:hypothetical protein